MSILKELNWHNNNGDFSELESRSLTHAYSIVTDGLDKFKVAYYFLSGGTYTKFATGFATIDEAKAWAWNHYNEKMQPYTNNDTISAYFDRYTQWGLDRGIIQNGNVLAQGLKLVSELGELTDNLAKGRCIKDDVGDCMVVLNMLAQMTNTPLVDCLEQAWGDIKDRKGYMNEHGVFIKEGDDE